MLFLCHDNLFSLGVIHFVPHSIRIGEVCQQFLCLLAEHALATGSTTLENSAENILGMRKPLTVMVPPCKANIMCEVVVNYVWRRC